MFKLASDLKTRYPEILKIILKNEEIYEDLDYLLNDFSN